MNLKKSKFLAAALTAFVFLSAVPFSTVKAEEGMFMLDKIASLPLAKKGLKISPNEIYNPNGGGLSEAVLQLSIGCTAEFVSPEGLILTNHHCAYDALVAASTEKANYGDVGYKADSRETELKTSYKATIILKSEDVTAAVMNGMTAAAGSERDAAIKKRTDEIVGAEKSKVGAGVDVKIQALNGGLFYYKFNTMTLEDIRIAYAPPKNIGFFGGDPDNFEWSRHCGDFSFMRAYVGKDGKPAAYSKDNVPYKPKKFISISMDGVKENDFTMIIGFPGGTNRYRESPSIAYNVETQIPFQVDFLKTQVKALETIGSTNPAKKVALQSDIFSLYNTIKAEDGGVVAMKRANLVAQRRADEAKFTEWVKQNPERQAKYGDALPALQKAYDENGKIAERDLILRYMPNIGPVEFVFVVITGQAVEAATKAELKNAIPEVLKGEPVSNRESFKFLLRRAAGLPADQKIAAIEKRFGMLQGEARIKAEDEFARQVFEGQMLTTEAGLNNLLNQTPEQIAASKDPFFGFLSELGPAIGEAFQNNTKFGQILARYRMPFMQAMFEMKNANPYPDANFTQRFTYGSVQGYTPREAVKYTPFTTLNGVIEKDTGSEPFDAPAKLRDLWQRKDFGRYNVNGTVPVNFLTTNDIIGGNSGSPVMNGNGEQVGIAFDGNYEGLGNDFFFSDDLGRTIIVDIRYVMFITEKFGGAGWILRELDVKGGNSKAMTATR